MARKAAFHTLGCRVNSYETEAMTEALRAAGYEIVPFVPGADVYVINTCTVTNIADRKSRQMLHKAKQMNPNAVVAAVGCYAEDGREKLDADPAVDLIVGNGEKSKLADLLDQYIRNNAEVHSSSVHDPAPAGSMKTYENLAVSGAGDRVRAFIKIQDGCNMFCTYCVIPYVRGRVRSRAPGDVIREAERLAHAGYRELILTGIHMSSYGTDFAGGSVSEAAGTRTKPISREAGNMHLLGLVRNVCAIDGVERVRFGSLEPGIMTETFVKELAAIPEICPQFHLSLQSGCDATLARMRRRYTTGEYTEICKRIRRHFHNPAITTDIIVGFPGETEDDFMETCAFAEKIGFAKIHIFKYSRRDGTKAASMAGQVPEAVKTARAAVLAGIEATLRRSYIESLKGNENEILVEERDHVLPGGTVVYRGHTREAVDALVTSREGLVGEILRVRGVGVTEDLRFICDLTSTT